MSELTRALDVDTFVPMLAERFGHRWGGDWPVRVEGRTEMALGVVGLDATDRSWIDEQTPRRARGMIHPRAVRHSLDDLHRFDDVVFEALARLEAEGPVAAGWSSAVDVVENRVVVVLAAVDATNDEALVAVADETAPLVPSTALDVVVAGDADARVRALVAPRRPDRGVGAQALGAAMSAVGELIYGERPDDESHVVAEAPSGDPPLDLDFGDLDPLD